ncbi:universal stress protein [Aureisphaera galaxeae]|uniref:universal stress protein n=1 Tax=Aureisphaera galaxeae TaxID=1538023 RepID=UPI0023506F97|nr:universal stress protein [Aureisphaera galaxeae]MDC8003777.1 universal stress protein [Aureisphaera galaxeae]
MKNILIPTDFSNNAYNALLYATQLFGKEPCKFYLLHSFESEVSRLTSRVDIGKSEEVIDELFASAETKLTELKHSITMDAEGKGHEFETIASSKRLPKEVNYLIKGMDIDFVIMGTKGQTGAKEVLLGSNTVRIIKKIKGAPLMVIPEHMDYRPLKHIAFATGFKFPYTEKELAPLLQLVALDEGALQILHVMMEDKLELDQKEHLSKLRHQLDSVTHDVYWLRRGFSKTEVITDHVYDNNIDVLVMIYYKHGFLKSLFRESIVKKVGLHPSIPFFMIPASK